MAYVLFNNETDNVGCSKIVANDTDKNNLLMDTSNMTFVSISDDDFTALRNGAKSVKSRDGNTVNYTTNVWYWPDRNVLENYIETQIKKIKLFTDNFTSHPAYSEWNTFKNALESFDYGNRTFDDDGNDIPDYVGITFPSNDSFKTLCENNSITFKNIDELPL